MAEPLLLLLRVVCRLWDAPSVAIVVWTLVAVSSFAVLIQHQRLVEASHEDWAHPSLAGRAMLRVSSTSRRVFDTRNRKSGFDLAIGPDDLHGTSSVVPRAVTLKYPESKAQLHGGRTQGGSVRLGGTNQDRRQHLEASKGRDVPSDLAREPGLSEGHGGEWPRARHARSSLRALAKRAGLGL
ncbi:unnamed protein product [Durusdinium trenchii]|uniref:Uncharacterized protein n=1 Tax=Durusdinium trenchii TaxID=1381693 RepID=A0ABP0KJ94_9DINO